MRITKVYTRTGDNGTTRLGDGQQVTKNHVRVAAYGDLDELNSQLGWVLTQTPGSQVTDCLKVVQNDLFNLGGELSAPGLGSHLLAEADVQRLEDQIDDFNAELPALKEFILPGGSPAAAALHLARTTCRRAERSLIELHGVEPQRDVLLRYVNRLSDLLFVLARYENHRGSVTEVYWQKP